MTNKEFLQQAYYLDLRIENDIEELRRLRAMVTDISPPKLGDRVQTSHSGEAPFVRGVEKILLLEKKITSEIEALTALKRQIPDAIGAVPDPNERMVLYYRYIERMTWESIGAKLYASERTVRRWHENGLLHLKQPENS